MFHKKQSILMCLHKEMNKMDRNRMRMSYKDFIKSNGYLVKKLVALVVVASILMSAGVIVLAIEILPPNDEPPASEHMQIMGFGGQVDPCVDCGEIDCVCTPPCIAGCECVVCNPLCCYSSCDVCTPPCCADNSCIECNPICEGCLEPDCKCQENPDAKVEFDNTDPITIIIGEDVDEKTNEEDIEGIILEDVIARDEKENDLTESLVVINDGGLHEFLVDYFSQQTSMGQESEAGLGTETETTSTLLFQGFATVMALHPETNEEFLIDISIIAMSSPTPCGAPGCIALGCNTPDPIDGFLQIGCSTRFNNIRNDISVTAKYRIINDIKLTGNPALSQPNFPVLGTDTVPTANTGWIPIGTLQIVPSDPVLVAARIPEAFQGKLDGKKPEGGTYKISGLEMNYNAYRTITVNGVLTIVGGNNIGLFGGLYNAEITNLTIELSPKGIVGVGGIRGALAGSAFGNTKIENVNVVGAAGARRPVTGDGAFIGGIVGVLSNSTITGSSVNNINVNGGSYTGGMIGLAYRDVNGNANILGCNVENVGVNVNNTTVNLGFAGGLAGAISYVNLISDKVTVNGINITNVSVTSGNNTVATSYAGGFAGQVLGGSEVRNIVINNATVLSNGSFAGGFAGQVLGETTSNIIRVNNATVTTRAGHFAGGYAGQVIGKSINTDVIIKGGSVTAGINSNLFSWAGGFAGEILGEIEAKNIEIDGVVVRSNLAYAGGFAGKIFGILGSNSLATNGFNLAANNIKIEDVRIKTPDVMTVPITGSYAGGFAGEIIGNMDAKNIEITRGTVDSNLDFAGGFAGVVAGNISIEDIRISEISVSSRHNIAGGFAGAIADLSTANLANAVAQNPNFGEPTEQKELRIIKNIRVTNPTVRVGTGGLGGCVVGGFAGAILGFSVVENVIVKGVRSTTTVSANVDTFSINAGGFAGIIYDGATVRRCYVIDATVNSIGWNVGGFAGGIYGLPIIEENGVSQSSVTAKYTRVGGFAGTIFTTRRLRVNFVENTNVTGGFYIDGCFVGGFVGELWSAPHIKDNYANAWTRPAQPAPINENPTPGPRPELTVWGRDAEDKPIPARVTGTGGTGVRVGGFAGYTHGKIEDSYAAIPVTGESDTGKGLFSGAHLQNALYVRDNYYETGSWGDKAVGDSYNTNLPQPRARNLMLEKSTFTTVGGDVHGNPWSFGSGSSTNLTAPWRIEAHIDNVTYGISYPYFLFGNEGGGGVVGNTTTFNVTLNANHGKFGVDGDSNNITLKELPNIPSNTALGSQLPLAGEAGAPTLEGHKLIGWSTGRGHNGVGATVNFNKNTPILDNVTVYAVWIRLGFFVPENLFFGTHTISMVDRLLSLSDREKVDDTFFVDDVFIMLTNWEDKDTWQITVKADNNEGVGQMAPLLRHGSDMGSNLRNSSVEVYSYNKNEVIGTRLEKDPENPNGPDIQVNITQQDNWKKEGNDHIYIIPWKELEKTNSDIKVLNSHRNKVGQHITQLTWSFTSAP